MISMGFPGGSMVKNPPANLGDTDSIPESRRPTGEGKGNPLQYSVQFSRSFVSNSLQSHGLQHTRLPYPSPTPGACSNSCPFESVTPSNHLILWHSLLLPSIFPSVWVFSNESVLCIRWPKYWSFSFSFSPSNIQDWFPLGLTGLIFTLSKVLLKAFSNTTVKSIMCHWKTSWLIMSI